MCRMCGGEEDDDDYDDDQFYYYYFLIQHKMQKPETKKPPFSYLQSSNKHLENEWLQENII